MKSAKALCYFLLSITALLFVLSFKVPAVVAFGNSEAGWITACVVAIIVGLVALRAIASR